VGHCGVTPYVCLFTLYVCLYTPYVCLFTLYVHRLDQVALPSMHQEMGRQQTAGAQALGVWI
jgi:hypothetical protein